MSVDIIGIGGIYITSPDPARLCAWYRDVLGVDIEAWGGMKFEAQSKYNDAPDNTVWKPYKPGGAHFDMAPREFMINFVVSDMDDTIEYLESVNVPILARKDDETNGRFIWIQDPDGTKIELWEEGSTWKFWKDDPTAGHEKG